jgi:hypothetical protein
MIATLKRYLARSAQSPITVRRAGEDYLMLAGDELTMENGSITVVLTRENDGALSVRASASASGSL